MKTKRILFASVESSLKPLNGTEGKRSARCALERGRKIQFKKILSTFTWSWALTRIERNENIVRANDGDDDCEKRKIDTKSLQHTIRKLQRVWWEQHKNIENRWQKTWPSRLWTSFKRIKRIAAGQQKKKIEEKR